MSHSDQSQRFLFDDTDVRGEMVDLERSYSEVLAKHPYPEPVAQLLGEMLAAASLLCGTLKFDGLLVLQARSSGAVPLLMVECSSDRQVRGLARYSAESIGADAGMQELMPEGVLTLTVDPVNHQLLDAKAQNIVVDPARYTPLPEIAALQADIEARSNEHLNKPVARIATREITRTLNDAGESAMGDLIADAQLHATRALGADVALTNLGGIRTDLILEPGQQHLTYGQVASVQPFNNTLNILTLSGTQLKQLLEQQWQNNGFGFYPLQPSASLTYRWDTSKPQGQRILADSLKINGKPVLPEQRYRVTVNSFMAGGGDNFTVLNQASQRVDTGLNDLQALVDYLQARDHTGQPAGAGAEQQRIEKVGQALADTTASNGP